MGTCHQIRTECLPVFYGGNTFEVDGEETTTTLLTHLDPERLKMLRSVRAFHVFEFWIQCTNPDDLDLIPDDIKEIVEIRVARTLYLCMGVKCALLRPPEIIIRAMRAMMQKYGLSDMASTASDRRRSAMSTAMPLI